MKAIVFAYHNMGVMGISKLLEAGFTIPLVFTHEDDADEHIWFGSVAERCRQAVIPCVAPENPDTSSWIARIQEERPDIIFSFYYRKMLPREILAIPPLGAYNLHGSYLPAYRGRCPVNWVVIKGETLTGVTLHEMVAKPDAGPIVAQKKVEIAFDDTAQTLFDKLVQAASAMLDEVLPGIKAKHIPKFPQDLSRGSYYGGRKPDDGRINWQKSALELYNLIRGVTRPYPGAFCFLGAEKLTVWGALPRRDVLSPAGFISVGDARVEVGTGRGSIELIEIEIDKTVLKGDELLVFFKDHEGELLQ